MKTVDIKRKDAARLLESLMQAIAEDNDDRAKYHGAEPTKLALRLQETLKSYGLEVPYPCRGEAHDPSVGGQIDHCMSCAPNWGWTAAQVKVK